jgi:hypothetical protein
MESKSFHYIVLVEADSYLKQLPPSTLDTCALFEHIDRLSIGIQQQPYTVLPTLLGSVFGVLGSGSLLESR